VRGKDDLDERAMIWQYEMNRDNATRLPEASLIKNAQVGDLEAFNQLVIAYQDQVFSLSLRILGDGDSAEDITQDTFLAAYHSLPRFRGGSFRNWLYRIATNACLDEIRKRKRHPMLSLEEGEEAYEISLLPYGLQGSDTLPEKEYERIELEQAIQKCLNLIDVDQRAVVVLVDINDLDYLDAAQILGIPLGTVKSRLARARLRLRDLLN
jgi:RNA polymerase sigma factor (sigma-70 family)